MEASIIDLVESNPKLVLQKSLDTGNLILIAGMLGRAIGTTRLDLPTAQWLGMIFVTKVASCP